MLAYSNWLGLMDRSLSVPVEKRGRSVERRLEGPRSWTKPNGKGSVNLSSQALLLARNVGMHMYTDMVLTADGTPVPEHFVDAMTTAAAALHDVRAHFLNSRHGSIYIVKPKMHGPEECAFAARLFDAVEQASYPPPVSSPPVSSPSRPAPRARPTSHALPKPPPPSPLSPPSNPLTTQTTPHAALRIFPSWLPSHPRPSHSQPRPHFALPHVVRRSICRAIRSRWV